MASYSLANHILRTIIIWAMVFATIYVQNIKLDKKIMIASLVTVFYLVTEYLLMPLYVPDFCNMVCPPPMNSDTSVDEAISKLQLNEFSGPAIRPPPPPQEPEAPTVSTPPTASVPPTAPSTTPVVATASVPPTAPSATAPVVATTSATATATPVVATEPTAPVVPVPLESKLPTYSACPVGFSGPNSTGRCIASYKATCGERCAKDNCVKANGQWIPLDYSKNPYTCQMPLNKL
jgi:hypothetical protein